MVKQAEKNEWLSWQQELKTFQEADLDQRQQSREADRFVLDKDGQWEENVARNLDSQKRPRYTFDQATPVIEDIMADIEDMDFGAVIKPGAGEATKEIALVYEGMIRSIEADSNATDIYRNACRRNIRRGFDAWIVRNKYKDSFSFEQDLCIEKITNAINRVWSKPNSEQEDNSDCDVTYVLTSLSPEEYKDQFPKGKGISVDDMDLGEHWDEYRPEVITIAERFYRKEVNKEVVQLSNGDVIEVNEKYNTVIGELSQQGITEVNRKKAKDYVFYHRVFDGGGMLTPEKETVFDTNPVVTIYGNYEHMGESSKKFYSGVVLKLMDYQRVFNYAKSREVEEGALAPREKTWMTKKQAAGHEKQLSAMNVSADPVQFYNPDQEAPQPYKTPPSQINPHLSKLSEDMSLGIRVTSNVNDAMRGDMAGRMSEEALRMQIDRGTGGTRKWVNALARGIRRTAEILVRTIPKVYDTKRQFMILGDDGKEEMVTLNDEVWDNQTQSMVKLNVLNKGKYKTIVNAGPAFANKMEAGRAALLEYAAIDPTTIQTAGDVILKTIDAPYVDKIAERKREQMLQQGLIPVSQMTDEELQQMQAQAQQPQPEDPAVMLERMKIQEQILSEQNRSKQLEIEMYKLQQKDAELMIKGRSSQLDNVKKAAEIDKTVADTAKSWADTEKTSGESTAQQIENLQNVTQQTSIMQQ